MIIIGIILYVLWYISTHSPVVSLNELFAVSGGILAIFGILFADVKNDLRRLEDKIDRWIEKSYNNSRKRSK